MLFSLPQQEEGMGSLDGRDQVEYLKSFHTSRGELAQRLVTGNERKKDKNTGKTERQRRAGILLRTATCGPSTCSVGLERHPMSTTSIKQQHDASKRRFKRVRPAADSSYVTAGFGEGRERGCPCYFNKLSGPWWTSLGGSNDHCTLHSRAQLGPWGYRCHCHRTGTRCLRLTWSASLFWSNLIAWRFQAGTP